MQRCRTTCCARNGACSRAPEPIRTDDLETIVEPTPARYGDLIERVVLVPRLREVAALSVSRASRPRSMTSFKLHEST